MKNSVWADRIDKINELDKHAKKLAKLSKFYLEEYNILIKLMQQTNEILLDQTYRDFQTRISKEQPSIEALNKVMQMYLIYMKRIIEEVDNFCGDKLK